MTSQELRELKDLSRKLNDDCRHATQRFLSLISEDAYSRKVIGMAIIGALLNGVSYIEECYGGQSTTDRMLAKYREIRKKETMSATDEILVCFNEDIVEENERGHYGS